MIHEHALRKVEFYLHQYCLDQEVKPILDNILKAGDRGYSVGSYLVRGHFVLAPVEDIDARVRLSQEEVLWPFTTESQARHFLAHLKNYFEVRGVKADILGIEGFVLR